MAAIGEVASRNPARDRARVPQHRRLLRLCSPGLRSSSPVATRMTRSGSSWASCAGDCASPATPSCSLPIDTRHSAWTDEDRVAVFNGSGVDLYRLPLGASGHSVRLNGRLFEAVAARVQHRRMFDLDHAALEVRLGTERFRDRTGSDSRRARRAARCRRGRAGRRALGGADAHPSLRGAALARRSDRRHRLSCGQPSQADHDPDVARRLWQSAADLPTPVWGRDELGTGEMWNSNSVISWLITRSGLDVDSIRPPAGGRAPGWQAGVVLAGRLPAKIPCRSLVDVRTGSRVGERGGGGAE